MCQIVKEAIRLSDTVTHFNSLESCGWSNINWEKHKPPPLTLPQWFTLVSCYSEACTDIAADHCTTFLASHFICSDLPELLVVTVVRFIFRPEQCPRISLWPSFILPWPFSSGSIHRLDIMERALNVEPVLPLPSICVLRFVLWHTSCDFASCVLLLI